MTRDQAQALLERRYAAARQGWADNPLLRDYYAHFGITERPYCDTWVGVPRGWARPPGGELPLDRDAAFAAGEVGRDAADGR